MQISEHPIEKIHKKGECRNKTGNIKNTTKQTLFCIKCNHRAYIENHVCQCCLSRIKKPHTQESALKRFDKIIQEPTCKAMIDEWIAMPSGYNFRPKFHIKMGHQIFAVSIRWLAEYRELTHQEGIGDKYINFIEGVKRSSILVGIEFVE